MYSYRVYQNKYNGTEEMFLFKVGFNSLIKILSWISSLKLHELLARIEKSSGQTTILQKSMWSCMADVWELFFPCEWWDTNMSRGSRSIITSGFNNVFSIEAVTLKIIN